MTALLPSSSSVTPELGQGITHCFEICVEDQAAPPHRRNGLTEKITYIYPGDQVTGYAVAGFAYTHGLSLEGLVKFWAHPYRQELAAHLTDRKIFPLAVVIQNHTPRDRNEVDYKPSEVDTVQVFQLYHPARSMWRQVGGVERLAARVVTFHDHLGEAAFDHAGHCGYRYDADGQKNGNVTMAQSFNVWEVIARLCNSRG